jgi:hypothetical protein
MSTMLVEIYDALKEGGASEERARAAATSLTRRDQRFDWVMQRLDHVERRLGALEERIAPLVEQKLIALVQDVAVIRAELGLMKWMHGITIGGVLALLVKAFFGCVAGNGDLMFRS